MGVSDTLGIVEGDDGTSGTADDHHIVDFGDESVCSFIAHTHSLVGGVNVDHLADSTTVITVDGDHSLIQTEWIHLGNCVLFHVKNQSVIDLD